MALILAEYMQSYLRKVPHWTYLIGESFPNIRSIFAQWPFKGTTMDSSWEIYNILHEYDIIQAAGILCILTPHLSSQSLYVLAMKTWPLLQLAESLLSSTSTLVADLHQLLKDANMLNAEFSKWPAGQPAEWRPSTIAFIDPGQIVCAQGFGRFPGRIDSYLDRKYNWSWKLACLLTIQSTLLQSGIRTARLTSLFSTPLSAVQID
jgi:hypothetical protein